MSNKAINWAFGAKLPKSSDKLLLVCLANYANDEGVCWPSQAKLADETSLDRKTVITGMRRLNEGGWIVDTGHRRGSNGQIVIYRLMLERVREVPRFVRDEDLGANFSGESPVFPVPNFPEADTVFPKARSRISQNQVPFLGQGTTKEPSIEPPRNPQEDTRDPDPFVHPEPQTDPPEVRAPGSAAQEPEVVVAGASSDEPGKVGKRSQAKVKTRVREDWWPDDAGLAFAAERSVKPIDEVPRFIAYHQQHGNLMLDWSAAWRTWCMNQVRFRERDSRQTGPGSQPKTGRVMRGMEIILGRPLAPAEPPPHPGPRIDADRGDWTSGQT